MSIQTLKHDDKGNISITIDKSNKNIVNCALTAKPDNQSPVRYQMYWKFDFDGVSVDEIKEIAANYLKIRAQDAWRKDPNYKDDSYADKTFKVMELINKQRTRKSPAEKILTQVKKLSKAERDALLRELA